MDRFWTRSVEVILILLAPAILASCATIQLNPVPAPPPTAKLRVFVQPLTGEGRWGTPHEAYAENQVRRVARFLERTGIYDVVGAQDVRFVLGDRRMERRQLEPDGWALARRIGEALHADYVIVMERVKQRGAVGGADFLFVNVMVNVGTGRVFESRTQIVGMTRGDRDEQHELIRTTYRDIFQSCKQDMLATAIRKGRRGPSGPAGSESSGVPKETVPLSVAPSPPPASQEPATPSEEKQRTSSPAPAKGPLESAGKAPDTVPAVKGPGGAAHVPGLIDAQKKDGGAKKLVIYDFDASDQYRTVALILAEALREEVFKLKQYILVNREDLQKVLEEMALQQTGLIDEKEAVRTGKGLAANRVVTGKLGLLGKIFVMQAKCVDVETFATLGISSVKFSEGQEDEALNKLPGFARALVGL